MKLILMRITIITMVTLGLSCSQSKETHLIGKVKELRKGVIYLKKVENNKLIIIDSVYLKGSDSFDFKLDIDEPDVYHLHLDKKDGIAFNDFVEVFLEPSKIVNVTTSLNKFKKELIITGSENHKRFSEFKKINNQFSKQRFSLLKANIRAVKNNNKDSINLIANQLENSLKRKYLYTVNFALANKNYEVAPYTVLREIKDINVKYLDTIYNSLEKRIQVSKYGKKLKKLIKRKNSV